MELKDKDSYESQTDCLSSKGMTNHKLELIEANLKVKTINYIQIPSISVRNVNEGDEIGEKKEQKEENKNYTNETINVINEHKPRQKKIKKRIENREPDEEFTSDELNEMEYNEAIKNDNRPIITYFICIVTEKEIIF